MLALEKFCFKKKGTVPPLDFLPEPVVHSTEWSTGSQPLPRFGPVSQVSARASGPLDGVVHWLPAFAPVCAFFPGFQPSQWSTRQSGPLAFGFCPVLRPFPQFPAELVVHSAEWTTSSWRLPCFGLFYLVS